VWNVVLIGVGGGIGTALRYGIAVGAARWLGLGFPWGTLAVNVIGSLLLGVVMELAGTREIAGVQAKLVLGAGVLGGFTTYSSFNLETIRLAEQGAYGRAGAYLLATLLGCLLAGVAGVALARSLRGE
jgi:CrcB protein